MSAVQMQAVGALGGRGGVSKSTSQVKYIGDRE
jgi:hypothetical protein